MVDCSFRRLLGLFSGNIDRDYLQEALDPIFNRPMNKLQLDDFLPYHLVMSADLISRSLSRVYARHGLTIPEWRILIQLQANESLTPSEIGYLAKMEKARISRALVLMDKKDLIIRKQDESDKRVSHIMLSGKG
ncbi:MAG: DNA-binding transcriptional regulator, MarR family, partial [uncultured Thiotrichaceae bacterium]